MVTKPNLQIERARCQLDFFQTHAEWTLMLISSVESGENDLQ